MRQYILYRLIYLIPVLLGVSFLTFSLLYISPGNPALSSLSATGIAPDPKLLELTEEKMGLNKPFIIQYKDWMISTLQGNLGTSYKYNHTVTSEILNRLPATLKLTALSLLLVVLISFPFGIISALNKNCMLDYIIKGFSFIGISMPGFWLGLILMYIFGVQLHLLPVIGRNNTYGIILPAVTLALPLSSKYLRQIRIGFLEESTKDYVIAARSRGTREYNIIFKHILPNTLLPMITLLGITTGALLGGTAIVETIFSWPGVGEMAVEGIFSQDYPLLQGYVLWMAFVYVFINLLVDILHHYLDPRLRYKDDN